MGYDVTVGGAGRVGGASLDSNADVAAMYASLLSQLESGVPMEEIQKGLRKPTGKADLDATLKQIADSSKGSSKSSFAASLISTVGPALAQSYGVGAGTTSPIDQAKLAGAANTWAQQGAAAPSPAGASLQTMADTRLASAARDQAARANVLDTGNLSLLLGSAVAREAANYKGGGRAGQGYAAAANFLGTYAAIGMNQGSQGAALPSAADLKAGATATTPAPTPDPIVAGANIGTRRAEIAQTGAAMMAEARRDSAAAQAAFKAAEQSGTPADLARAGALADRAKAMGDYATTLTNISNGWFKVSDANGAKLADASARFDAANAALGGAPAPAAAAAPAPAAAAAAGPAPAAVAAAGLAAAGPTAAAAGPTAAAVARAAPAAARPAGPRVEVPRSASTEASSSAAAALAKAKEAEPDYEAIKLGKVGADQQAAAKKAAEAATTELGAAKADVSKQKLQVDAQIMSLKAQPSLTAAEKKLVGALEAQSKYLGDVGAHVQARMDSVAAVNTKLGDGNVSIRENMSMGTDRIQVGVRGNQLREQGADIDAAVAAAFADVTKERAGKK